MELYQFNTESLPFALFPKCPKAVSVGIVARGGELQ